MDDESDLQSDSAVYRTLLESTKAIPWKVDWASKRFTYIGPQIEALLGWQPESWITIEDWAARMHPDDRDYVVNFCVAQSQAGLDHEADYRALTKDNGHVWIRDVVHVVRNDQGEPEALVGFMFDISERKKTEERLLAMQKELEALSFKDGLTNIANRRRFNASLELEWESARSNGQPLSVLMFDIDFFKQYNDKLGHLAGDDCLRRVAETLSASLARGGDAPARYGGEEFVVILPETPLHGALIVAEKARQAICDLKIPHPTSPHGCVTMSMGIAEWLPGENDAPGQLIQAADQALYQAKAAGRNRVIHGALADTSSPVETEI